MDLAAETQIQSGNLKEGKTGRKSQQNIPSKNLRDRGRDLILEGKPRREEHTGILIVEVAVVLYTETLTFVVVAQTVTSLVTVTG